MKTARNVLTVIVLVSSLPLCGTLSAAQEPIGATVFDSMDQVELWQPKDGAVCGQATERRLEGTGAVKLSFTAQPGTWPCIERRVRPQDWSRYTHLTFQCYAETDGPELPRRAMVVVVYSNNRKAFASVDSLKQGAWVTVAVPLGPLADAVNLSEVTRLKFSAASGFRAGSKTAFYIDNVMLIAAASDTHPAEPKRVVEAPAPKAVPGEKLPLILKINPMKRADFDGATVPAIAEPMDKLGGRVCRGEFENYAFIINPKRELRGVTVTWGDLRGPATIPAAAVDARIAKVWWVAHRLARMGSSRLKKTPWRLWKPRLVADVLVHDDALIRVRRNVPAASRPELAREEVLNEIRVGRGDRYVVVNRADVPFPADATVYDADRLQPFDIPRGLKKQIWLTVDVPDDVPSGTYRTTIVLKASGRPLAAFPLEIEVLPFDLEPPGMVYGLYYRGRFDIPPRGRAPDNYAKTMEQYRLELADMRDHGIPYPGCQINLSARGPKMLDQILDIYEELGLATDRFFYLRDQLLLRHEPGEIQRLVATWSEVLKRHNPKGVFYCYALDERRGEAITAQIPKWDAIHAAGGKVFASISVGQFAYTRGKLDVPVLHGGQMVEDQRMDRGFDAEHRAEIELYRQSGHCEFWSYAHPFPAIEDPELFRRNYGTAMWRAGYTGMMLWTYQSNPTATLFNDFCYDNYRNCTLAFPITGGLLATVQWEGLREAVDDMRYLRTLQKAADAAGRRSEIDRWLRSLDFSTGDLDRIRARFIDKTLELFRAKYKKVNESERSPQ
ncbi:MAG: hypothetical protein GXP27_15150 [Planctomycetes bacterium]|nr:hypothetical protein [Planctomycetota bacterium]